MDECLTPLLKPAVKARGFAEARVLTDWPNIVGAQLASHTQPIAVRGQPGGKRVLHVAVAQAYATQLHYAQPMILERIATYFGARAIDAVQVVATLDAHSAPSASAPTLPAIPMLATKPKAAPIAASIPLPALNLDDPLEAALADLAKALQERRQLK